MRTRAALALSSATVLALSSCGGTDAEDEESASAGSVDVAEDNAEPEASPGDQEAAPDDGESGDGESGDGESGRDATRGTAADVGGPYGELRDGTWAVGPAGEVEFRVLGPDRLELVDVRAAQGWRVTDTEAERDEIEVDFARGPVEYEIEVEIEGGVLEIEIDQDVDPAEPGRFDVGEAGTVDIAVEGGRPEVAALDLADGWSEVSRDVEDDEIEIDFRRDGDGFVETWELDAEVDDGRLEVTIDYEIEGRFNG